MVGNRLMWAAVAAVMGAAGLVGCGDSDEASGGGAESTAGAQSTPVKICGSMPLSGDLAALGESATSGFKLAVDEINAKGGAGGRTLELDVKDDGADPATAGGVVRDCIEDDATAILGSYGSAQSLVMTKVAEDAKVPNVMPFASDPSIVSHGYAYLTNLFASAVVAERVADEFITQDVKPTGVALVYGDAPYTVAGAEASRKNLETAGIAVKLFEKFDIATEDYAALATKAKQSGADVVKFYGFAPSYIGFMQAMKQIDFNPRLVYEIFQTGFEPRSIEALGATGDYIVGQPLMPEDTTDFDERYKAANGGKAPAGQEVYQAYSAIQVIADAIGRVKSDDADELAQALRSTKLDTVAGSMEFDDQGQRIAEPELGQLIPGDGAKIIYEPGSGATGAWKPWVPFSERG